MQLKAWVNSHPTAERRLLRESIARAMGVSEVAVRHWVNGIRRVPGTHCIPLELLTGRQVTRYELRPDIFGKPPEGRGKGPAPALRWVDGRE
jgi:Putative antitoxin of bacterial toxin-antitoxin system, YdaS/YdaT